MKDKKITILQILILVMIIVCILVAIILMVLNNNPEKSEIGQVNSTKQEVSNKPTETNSKNKGYIPNASDEEKIQRGEELFGYEKCSLSEFCLKNEEEMYEDKENPMMAGQAETSWSCAICGKTDIYPNTAVPKLCGECAEITNRCMDCGKLKLDE